jgi:hypothetical protein
MAVVILMLNVMPVLFAIGSVQSNWSSKHELTRTAFPYLHVEPLGRESSLRINLGG